MKISTNRVINDFWYKLKKSEICYRFVAAVYVSKLKYIIYKEMRLIYVVNLIVGERNVHNLIKLCSKSSLERDNCLQI